MSESSEVLLARQGERLQVIQEWLAEDRKDKKELGKRVEQILTMLTSIENRVQILEETTKEHAPVFEEIVQLKHEIAGAKKVTRWLWVALTGVLAVGISIKSEILDMFTK